MNKSENFSNLLNSLSVFKLEFEITAIPNVNCDEVILQEIVSEKERKRIIVQVFNEPPSYSACLYKEIGEDPNAPHYKFVYEIKVKGENVFEHIKQNVEDLISGKKGKPHNHSIPL